MARVKGLTFADAKLFVSERGGDEAWRRLRALLPATDQALLDEVIAVGWYPLEAQLHVLEAMPVALGDSITAVMRDYARFAAARHVGRVYRLLFRFANPALVLEKSGEYWSRFYDTGEWKVVREAPNKARGELVGFVNHAVFCESMNQYIEQLFGLVGAKDVRVSHVRCRTRGDGSCAWTVEWK